LSSQWSLSFWFSHQYPICIPLLPHSCYMPRPMFSCRHCITMYNIRVWQFTYCLLSDLSSDRLHICHSVGYLLINSVV
jgi:hypothetical protein